MADKTASVSGLWSATATWGGAAVPADGESVLINNDITVYFDADHGPTANGGVNFTTGVNGIVLNNAGSTLRFATPNMNGSALLPTRKSTISNGGNGAASGQKDVVVVAGANFLVGQQVVIQTSSTVYEVNVIATIVSNTLTMVNNIANTYADGANVFTISTYLKMKTGTAISGAGALYVGNSPTTNGEQIPNPPANTAKVSIATIEIIGTGQITNTGGQYYYGWIPTTPAITLGSSSVNGVISSPAFTTMSGYTNTTTFTLTADMALQKGDKLLIGAKVIAGVQSDANKGVYTTSTYGVGSATEVVLSGAMATNVRAAGDYVARYNRPITLIRATFGTTANTVTNGIMQGVFMSGFRWTSGANWQFKGCTIECANTAMAGFTESNPTANHRFIDCVCSYPGVSTSGSGSGLSYNSTGNYYQGCIGMNGASNALDAFTSGCVFVNCVSENCIYGLSGGNQWTTGPASNKFINCTTLANTYGGLGYLPTDCIYTNCASNTSPDLYSPQKTRLYNCTLSSTAGTLTGYATRAPWNNVQSYDQNGTAGLRRCWCRGGLGVTGAYGSPYNAYTNPMQFTVNLQNTATIPAPVIWEKVFDIPANKAITIQCPMARDTTNIQAELWVYSQTNDPLWFDPSWQVMPTQSTSCATSGSSTATYVVGRTALTAGVGVWQTLNVNIPLHTSARKLVARIIAVNNTAASGCLYADIDTLDKTILAKKRIIL